MGLEQKARSGHLLKIILEENHDVIDTMVYGTVIFVDIEHIKIFKTVVSKNTWYTQQNNLAAKHSLISKQAVFVKGAIQILRHVCAVIESLLVDGHLTQWQVTIVSLCALSDPSSSLVGGIYFADLKLDVSHLPS